MSMHQRPVSDTFTFAAAASSATSGGNSKVPETEITSTDKVANGVSPETHTHQRPVSELIQKDVSISSEAEAIDRWFDDLASYEETMEAMARASLDQNFKDELNAIDQWFQVLSEAERTATLYSLLQHTTRVQQGFFIAYLQQLVRRENSNAARNGGDKNSAKARPRRAPGKPQLTITGTNEKYAKMYGEELEQDYLSPTQGNIGPMTAQPFKGAPRSANLYNATTRPKSAHLGAFQTTPRWTQSGNPSPSVRSLADSSAYGDLPSPADRTRDNDPALAAAAAAAAASSSNRWKPLTPTFSTFAEMAKTIERPRSAADADRGADPAQAKPGVTSAVGKSNNIVAARAPLGPPPAGSDLPNFSRPPVSARSASGKFVFREPLTADPIHRGGFRPFASSPALPPGLFPSSPSINTPTHTTWDPNSKKSTMLRDFSAGLLSDGRLMDTKVGSKEAAAISRMLNGKGKLGNKEKKKQEEAGAEKSPKPPEPIDFALLEDIPAWFRSMRLHKYTPLFESMTWRELVVMSDEQLSEKGVSALGARRKMLKVFDTVKQEAEANGIEI